MTKLNRCNEIAHLSALIFLTVLITIGMSGSLQAQGTVSGTVLDVESNDPLADATVSIAELDLQTVTDKQGRFKLSDVPTGSHELSIRKPSFVERVLRVQVEDGEEVTLGDISLLSLVTTPSEREADIPVITLDETEVEETDITYGDISGLLTASQDIFVSTAAYNFSAARFDIRGYDSQHSTMLINGIPFNDPTSGQVYWSQWGGLNDVFRNRNITTGLGASDLGFGRVGGISGIDVRASSQREQLRVSYAASNRSYNHRLMATYSTGTLPSGWAFSFSGSRRWAQEAYLPGSFYDAWSYFGAAEKKWNDNHSTSFNIIGAPRERGKYSGAIDEMYDLAGSHYYNSYWGYQDGEKRNARNTHAHQPIFLLSHDWELRDDLSITGALSYQFGTYGSTALDWYNAPDPRPNYYRKLPSYIEDPEVSAQVEEKFRNNESVRQINWQRMYDVNRHNMVTIHNVLGMEGNTHTGLRSKYIIEDRRYDKNQWSAAISLNSQVGDNGSFQAGWRYRIYTGTNYQEVEDLLGGDFYVDINQFAERDFPNDEDAIQNDLQRPNRILKEGDRFGYEYESNIRTGKIWGQYQASLSKWDLFAAGELSPTTYWRTGLVQNGLFPENSLGDSEKHSFTDFGVKGGATYKMTGRHYFFANAAYMTQAPYFRDAFISPRTRNNVVDGLEQSKITSGEAGYLLRAPYLKGRASAYYTTFDDQIFARSFYHDGFRAFVNYTMTNVDKQHMGVEFALEATILPGLSISGVASLGEYLYTSRPEVTVTRDNDAQKLNENEPVYIENFYVAGTPQQAYSLGLRFQSENYWFATLSANYFDRIFLDFNPVRRTADAVYDADIEPGSAQWDAIINQEQLDAGFTLDFFGGKSFKIGEDQFIYVNLGVNNILDNTDFKTGGYEQYRFDFEDHDPDAFPSRYFYMYGLNYYFSIAYRM